MEWIGLNELREKYLAFFESKGHLRLESFSLIPQNDKSLLLINSGMAPMKKYFTGEITPPRTRVTTCQKCIRTPDIERVGITARHGTYFEMLGNFSFGDYFKNEATSWAWEFCTKVLNLPVDKIWVSIYEDDDETFDIWTKKVGVSPERIVRLGKEDNFWEHGAGPCGPCSELYFDRGEKYGCGKEGCGVGCDCDRYVEFWNLVFTQFNNDGNNNYTPLDHPNIDTGMGLERLACIMQGVDNLFLVDTVQNIMKKVCLIADVKYGENEKTDISLRVITDHIRSTTFMIADGVMPSNEGRGYVLRRLLRRAARHGRLLGIKRPFLAEVCKEVIKENKNAYPELAEKEEFIQKLISVEEASFAKTIDQGLQLLNNIIDNADSKVFSGEDAFKLNDTFGFPLDLTKEIISEFGMSVDEERFRSLLNQQKERARNARKNAGADAWLSDNIDLKSIPKTEFVGYTQEDCGAKILAIIKDGKLVDLASEGESVVVVLDKTSFYAESGGQVGDSGIIKAGENILKVTDTQKDHSGIYLHCATIENGFISVGDNVYAEIDVERRNQIKRNHTAAHLLQASLREVLGNHVQQAGQLVNENEVRFDFTHFSALTAEQLAKVEKTVNEKILASIEVENQEMPIEEARKLGAMALFGEKYGSRVRVVKVDDFSIEFCGGTHVDNTAKLGLFKIISENSVASGVRRIEAVTGTGVLNLINYTINSIDNCAKILKANNKDNLTDRCNSVMKELKDQEQTIERLNSRIAAIQAQTLFDVSKIINGVRIIVANLLEEGNVTSEQLKTICDKVKEKAPKSAAVIIGKSGNKVMLAVAVGKEAQALGLHAGKLAKEVALLTGGNGGGKPDMAMAGVKDESKIEFALSRAQDIILDMIK